MFLRFTSILAGMLILHGTAVNGTIYFAAEQPPPLSIAPANAPLCYEFQDTVSLEEQLGKLKAKYGTAIYDEKIVENENGSRSLLAKKKDEESGITTEYFYSSSAAVCNEYNKQKNFNLPLQPGKYIYKDGEGELTLKREVNGKLTFSIGTILRNMVFMPICSLDGEIEGNKSIITFSDEMEDVKDSKCYVHFFSTSEWISVDSGNCDYFCGTNGFFDGLYLKQKIGCKPNKISRSRKKVK